MRCFLLLLACCFSTFGFAHQYGDIVISELLVDTEPPIGEKAVEYLEIYNRTKNDIQLKGFWLQFGEKRCVLPEGILYADSFAVLCAQSSVEFLPKNCAKIPCVSFPSLTNSSGKLALISSLNEVLFSLNYRDTWYGSAFKAEGGWSLECKDLSNFSGLSNNWTASIDERGGTPGRPNSVSCPNQDDLLPRCDYFTIPTNHTIELYFNKTMDAASLHNTAAYKLSPEISLIVKATSNSPYNQVVTLQLSDTLELGIPYNLDVSGLYDVSQLLLSDTVLMLGLPEKPDFDSFRLNEVLFNPKPTGCDYVEIVNTDTRWLDLSEMLLANRSQDGSLGKAYPLTGLHQVSSPGSIWLLSVSSDSVCHAGNFPRMPNFINMDHLPAYNDDAGSVVLLTKSGEILDEMTYSKNMHFELITNPEGVALEKLNPRFESAEPTSWASGASAMGFGTPGFKNAHYVEDAPVFTTIFDAKQTWMTPNNDGQDDCIQLNYRCETPSLVNLFIFDMQGRCIKTLAKSDLLGATGCYIWNGTDDHGRIVACGRYLLFTEVFNAKSCVSRQKMVLTVLY